MDAALNWMKEFLIIYFILTILMHLSAADQYKKYLKFFSGMILLLILIKPVLRLTGNSGRLEALISYEAFWEQLDGMGQSTKKLEYLQNSHYIQKYEQAMADGIMQGLQEQQIAVRKVEVDLTDVYEVQAVYVWLDKKEGQEDADTRKGLYQYLQDAYQLEGQQIVVY